MNLDALNSATKYPPIPTYHGLDPANGNLTETEVTRFPGGQVILTEKIDGTNGRIIVLPDGDWFIGSREEILYARGDRVGNPALGIAAALRPAAAKLSAQPRDYSAEHEVTWVFYLEVYGHRIGQGARQYTASGATGFRLFDVAAVNSDVLTWPREKISAWREHGGQSFLSENFLSEAARHAGAELVPRIATVYAGDLPQDLGGTADFLKIFAPATRASLDGGKKPGEAEGIVLRSADRSVIAKARFQDYHRTLRKLAARTR